MINIIINSYKEPKATARAVNAFLQQNPEIPGKFKIIAADPFPEVGEFIKKEVKDKRVEFFLDPGEGKAYALNLLIEKLYSKNRNDIFIFSDGDVFVSKDAVFHILEKFKDKKIGCVTARPMAIDSRKTKYGLWANVAFSGIDKARKKWSREKKFFECSGYLFAIRNGLIRRFPMETSEDSIIPYLFWRKGYDIAYADKAEVYVKNPDNWRDYINQRVRNIKAHDNLNKIAPNLRRSKSLFNEIKEGLFFAISQSRNIKEFLWVLQLYYARLYIYYKGFRELRKGKQYKDGWRETEIESTKTLD